MKFLIDCFHLFDSKNLCCWDVQNIAYLNPDTIGFEREDFKIFNGLAPALRSKSITTVAYPDNGWEWHMSAPKIAFPLKTGGVTDPDADAIIVLVEFVYPNSERIVKESAALTKARKALHDAKTSTQKQRARSSLAKLLKAGADARVGLLPGNAGPQ